MSPSGGRPATSLDAAERNVEGEMLIGGLIRRIDVAAHVLDAADGILGDKPLFARPIVEPLGGRHHDVDGAGCIALPDHLGLHGLHVPGRQLRGKLRAVLRDEVLAPAIGVVRAEGIEPSAYGLKVRCST